MFRFSDIKKIKTILLFAFIILQTSCAKDDDNTFSTLDGLTTPLQILQNGQWNMQSMSQTVLINDSAVSNQTAQINSQWEFLANNTLISYFSGEPTDTTSYVFNESSIIVDDVNYDVLTLTEQSLILKSLEVRTSPADTAVIELLTEITLDR